MTSGNRSTYSYGEIELISASPTGRTKEVRPAITIEVWQDRAGCWLWELAARTSTGGLLTGTHPRARLATRELAIAEACRSLIDFGRQPQYCARQGKLPNGWEKWLDKTFGDESRQLSLLDAEEKELPTLELEADLFGVLFDQDAEDLDSDRVLGLCEKALQAKPGCRQ